MNKLFWMCIGFLMFGLTACGTDTAITPTGGDVVTIEPDTGPDAEPDAIADMAGDTDRPTLCGATDDCPEGEVCTLTVSGLQCAADTGGSNGEMCAANTDCASGVCVDGLCADICESESDCPASFQCETQTVTTNVGDVEVDVCVPEPTPCLSNTDCTDPELCVVERTAGVVLECGDSVGAGELGSACTTDAECGSNLCVNDVCTSPCQRPNDCADDGSYVCESTMIATGNGNASINICVVRPPTVCLTDFDCTAPERCVAARLATDVEFTCGTPNAAGGEYGDACNSDSECAQNLCLGAVCASACQGNGDCSNVSDFTCELQNVDLGGGNSDSVQVCTPPVVCDDNDACRINETCYIRPAVAAVDLICRAPNVGGGGLGQVCATPLECASNLCLPTRFRDVCTLACNDDNDCGASGYTCQSVDIDAGGTGVPVSVCAPTAPPACTSNNDCATGTVCSFIPNAAGDDLETACVPSTGGDAQGVPCNDNDDCASLLCISNFCSAPCADSNQCATGQLCGSESITIDGITTTLDACSTPPVTQCTSSSDCADGVRVCSDIQDVNGVLVSFCEFPNEQGAQLGTSCTVNNDCRENVCLATVTDQCTVVCDDSAVCGAGAGCTPLGDLGFCADLCQDTAGCSNGNICTLNANLANDAFDQVCLQPIGANDIGDTCAGGGDCQSGLCLTSTLYTGVSCNVDTDCTNAGETCECPIDQPNCTVGKECATQEQQCTALCNDAPDCVSTFGGNILTACSPNTFIQRPDGNGTVQVSTCSQP